MSFLAHEQACIYCLENSKIHGHCKPAMSGWFLHQLYQKRWKITMMTSAYNTLPSRITAKIGTGSVSELANKEMVQAK